ncbi:hypothetical protein IV203_000923 [Nitzschia inconspicua]|uniref:Uncharacterized protein n=1 Tax=Nitzschia inconspicua TaxID=303405 RepID=A0A9K3L683_9STRA|nr:hypothetical protein IV203_000923 [Nitzschia inconspicua]
MLQMYFDDCERLDVDDPLWSSSLSDSKPWIMSLSEEKSLAMEKLLGYNPVSASKLTSDQVEEETLRWAVDTNIVWAGVEEEEDDDDDGRSASNERRRYAKYERINDLQVASSCKTILESLTFVWNVLANALQHQQNEDSDSCVTQLIVFPNSKPLWDYDVMVNMLMAVQICKPFLPSHIKLQLDLFHPKYKHSPRMWSPEMHSPFPTLGISLHDKSKTRQKVVEEEFDVDAARAQLDALFQSMDGNREYVTGVRHDNHAEILQQSMHWIHSQQHPHKDDMEWTIQMEDSPFLLYKTLWNTILTLNVSHCNDNPSSMVVVPSLDSHTLRRVAVTVNAALIRLNIPVRITQLYTRSGDYTKTNNTNSPPPYGMIQLSPVADEVTQR